MSYILNEFGFFRVAVVTPKSQVANVLFNLRCIKAAIDNLISQNVQLAVFPELCITGYSCGDLFYQETLLYESQRAIMDLASYLANRKLSIIVGVPLLFNSRLYNCAVFINDGKIIGIVPKTFLPRTQEYYEQRWFTSGWNVRNQSIDFYGEYIPFGVDLIFKATNFPLCLIGIEICEDLWSPQPISGDLALAGATIIANLSASNEIVGKCSFRSNLVSQQSARCISAYLYANAGSGESTSDTVYSGHSIISENGIILAQTERFSFDTQIAVADIDLQQIKNERIVSSSYSYAEITKKIRVVDFIMPSVNEEVLSIKRKIYKFPFVPNDLVLRAEHCKEIFEIQTIGLAKRLQSAKISSLLIGVSGGLDSTLALLVALNAFDKLNLSKTGIIAVNMPGFGTSKRTHKNASNLALLLGVSYKIINIKKAVLQHFKDIGHDENKHDITFENAQARERIQILMDMANSVNGLVLGTGDLSELALGWCTYNGDHMSMYNVNSGVPKTLIRSLITWLVEQKSFEQISDVLTDICATPISPELLPLIDDGMMSHSTENIIGPYELHDFFLYYFVRHKFSKNKIACLAKLAFEMQYTDVEINKWLIFFYNRFFSQQFKRSAMPDGPKVGSISLSPRSDWRMPSDCCQDVWLI